MTETATPEPKKVRKARETTHRIVSINEGENKYDLVTVDGTSVGKFKTMKPLWDKVRELKAGDCPQIKVIKE